MSALNQRVESALVSPDPKTTVLKVAESFGEKHFHVPHDIGELDIPDGFRKSNFEYHGEVQ